MWRNYLIITWRNLAKHRLPSILNLLGLSLAVGTVVVVYAFFHTLSRIDSCHEDRDRIFTVQSIRGAGKTVEAFGVTPVLLSPSMQADLPQVEQYTRVAWKRATVRVGEKPIRDFVWFVDPNFLDVFTFPLRSGPPGVLSDPNRVVLSDETAHKYFGDRNPVGEAVTIRFDNGREETFTVGGVAAPFPREASFRFTLLITYRRQYDLGLKEEDRWTDLTKATFLLLHRAGDAPVVARRLDRYIDLFNSASGREVMTGLRLVSLHDMSYQTADLTGERLVQGVHVAAFYIFPALAAAILLLACLNYMNTAIAAAATRLKEIGIRKVVGGTRRQLIAQFMVENLVLCLAAIGLGTYLAIRLLLPGFNVSFPDWPALSLSLTGDLPLWLFLGGLVGLTVLFAGGYPALYVSSFRPVTIFAGRQQFGRKNSLSRALLALQFVLAFLTVNNGLVFWANDRYLQHIDWGYDAENRIVFYPTERAQVALLEAQLRRHPDIVAMAGAQDPVGFTNAIEVADLEGQKADVYRYHVAPDYPAVLGIRLMEGRLFDEKRPGERDRAALVSASFARLAGWKHPLGETFRSGGRPYSVVGVVEDFYSYEFHTPQRPVFLTVAAPDSARCLTVHFRAGAGPRVAAAVEAAYRALSAGEPGFLAYQDQAFENVFRENERVLQVFGFIAFMALFLACIGLFGLATQDLNRRLKEICIRKILGARPGLLGGLLLRTFAGLLIGAALVAILPSYMVMDRLLDSTFRTRAAIPAWPFVVGFACISVSMLLTVGKNLYRVTATNPADILHNE